MTSSNISAYIILTNTNETPKQNTLRIRLPTTLPRHSFTNVLFLIPPSYFVRCPIITPLSGVDISETIFPISVAA